MNRKELQQPSFAVHMGRITQTRKWNADKADYQAYYIAHQQPVLKICNQANPYHSIKSGGTQLEHATTAKQDINKHKRGRNNFVAQVSYA